VVVNQQDPLLRSTDVASVVSSTNGVPILVARQTLLVDREADRWEREPPRKAPTECRSDGPAGDDRDCVDREPASAGTSGAGHEATVVEAPAAAWYLAEGQTGPFFDLWLHLANPGDRWATVEVQYLLPEGAPVPRVYEVGPEGRVSIHVDAEDPRLADTTLSMIVKSSNGVPLVAERTMWWPDAGPYEGHSESAAALPGTKWALADAEVGGSANVETYVLVANTSTFGGEADVTVVFDDGTKVGRRLALKPESRTTVAMGTAFPEAVNRRFSVVVEAVGATPPQIVVERSSYRDAGGRKWGAGSSTRATRLR